MTVDGVAVLSYHSSPLAAPGAGDAGGMTVYVRGLANALARRGVWTDVYTRADGNGRRMVELSPGVRVVNVEAGPAGAVDKEVMRAYIPEFTWGVRAFAVAQRLSYDLVHSHYWQSGLAADSLSTVWNVPLVHSNHTLGRVKNSNLAPGDEPESQARLDGEEAAIQAADVLIASTDEELEQLSCLYGVSHDRVKTLRPGVDHRIFRPGSRLEARSRLGLDADAAVLMYAGRIQPLKGLDLAMRAVAELHKRLERQIAFVVVGGASGPSGDAEVNRLARLARDLGIAERVDFRGPQPHECLPVYYRAADVVVSCSHSESFGLAALEAHACGVPVVGTAVGGLSYVVRHGESGWLVHDREPTLFADRLFSLLSAPDLMRSFRAEATRSAAAFSWESTADAFLDLYECLVRERAPELCTC